MKKGAITLLSKVKGTDAEAYMIKLVILSVIACAIFFVLMIVQVEKTKVIQNQLEPITDKRGKITHDLMQQREELDALVNEIERKIESGELILTPTERRWRSGSGIYY